MIQITELADAKQWAEQMENDTADVDMRQQYTDLIEVLEAAIDKETRANELEGILEGVQDAVRQL